MPDHVSQEKRSEIMRRVGTKNTGPELAVRRLVYALGYRYRLHRRDLPGTPDVVFPARMKVIFVHGCFWHGHARCPKARLPKSSTPYWAEKIERNRRRDRARIRALRALGWRALVVWQCDLKRPERVMTKIKSFLEE